MDSTTATLSRSSSGRSSASRARASLISAHNYERPEVQDFGLTSWRLARTEPGSSEDEAEVHRLLRRPLHGRDAAVLLATKNSTPAVPPPPGAPWPATIDADQLRGWKRSILAPCGLLLQHHGGSEGGERLLLPTSDNAVEIVNSFLATRRSSFPP